jgi:hypothetical protein
MSLWEKLKRPSAVERVAEERIYELVMREIESGQRRDGLWLKAVENSGGDEKRAKILYIKYRVQSMKDEIEISQSIREAEEKSIHDSLNGYDPTGHTPLMRAVLYQDVEQVELLLSKGADRSIKENNFGTSTALDMALIAFRRASSDAERSKLQQIVDALRE